MYSYDWIVLVTMGLDRWAQTRQRPAHRQATHEIEFEAAHQRHRDQLKAAQSPIDPARKTPHRLGFGLSVLRHFRSKGLASQSPVSELPQSQACLTSGAEACSSERAAS
jgi:hypothetical protein